MSSICPKDGLSEYVSKMEIMMILAVHNRRSRVSSASYALLFSLLLLTSCGSLSHIAYDKDDSGARRYAQLSDLRIEVDELAIPLIDDGTSSGMVVGVLLADGSRQYFCYGLADIAKKRGLRPDTLFAIGSIGKGFLSALLALKVRENVFDWNDNLAKLLPNDLILSDDAARITLLQLATHSSGLPRQPNTGRTAIFFLQYLFTGKNFYRHLDKDYLYDFLREFTAPSEPGINYSNIGYALIGHILELHCGRNLAELMEEYLTTPMELKASGYEPELLPGYDLRARGYAGDQPKFIRRGSPVPEWHLPRIMTGTGAMYSNAEDLLTYAYAIIHAHDNSPLEIALRDTVKGRVTHDGKEMALAWTIDGKTEHRIIYQIGFFGGGYSSYLGLDLDHGNAIVVLQNSFNWDEKVGHRLLLRLADAALIDGNMLPSITDDGARELSITFQKKLVHQNGAFLISADEKILFRSGTNYRQRPFLFLRSVGH